MISENIFLVTGGHGFLASRLIPFLHKNILKCKIIVATRGKRDREWQKYPDIFQLYGDVGDAKIWDRMPKTITHVFHLAAVIPRRSQDMNRAAIAEDNLLPLTHLIEKSQRWPNLKQVIFSSSISVYAKTGVLLNEDSPKIPIDIYGASKLAGEHLLSCLGSRGVRVVSLRYSSLYGCGQYQGTVLPTMVNRAIKKKEILVYGSGKRTQDFIYYDDAVNANFLAYKKQARGAFNIGSGLSVPMKELAENISWVFTNGEAKIVYLLEKEDHDLGFKLDISKAKRELDYQPLFQIKDGLKKLKDEMGVG